jgi:hypothetical protein
VVEEHTIRPSLIAAMATPVTSAAFMRRAIATSTSAEAIVLPSRRWIDGCGAAPAIGANRNDVTISQRMVTIRNISFLPSLAGEG